MCVRAFGWLLRAHVRAILRDANPDLVKPRLVCGDFLPPLESKNTAWYDLHVKKGVEFVDPPCWTLVGKDLFVDFESYKMEKNHFDIVVWQNQIQKEIRLKKNKLNYYLTSL